MNKKIFAVVLSTGLFVSPLARADHDDFEDRNATYGMARVVRVKPIIRMVRIDNPERECWQDEVRYRSEGRRYNVPASTVAGGAIGGLIGNQAGRGNARIGTTIAGAAFGALVGNAIAQNGNRNARSRHEVEYVKRCQIVNNERTEERIDGYWVDYEYRGEIYRTRMPYAPDRKIRVRVTVEPVAR